VKTGASPQWESQWKAGVKEGQAFDNAGATKSLDRLLKSRADVSNKTALVPGCGRGYDVARLAVAGYETTGLELAQTAVEEANTFVNNLESENPLFKAKDSKRVRFKTGNFFEFGDEASFDLAYDCTFLCAIHPDAREKWADQYRKLIKPGGELITLIFPICSREGGPPFAMSVELVTSLLTSRGFSRVELTNPLPPDEAHLGGKMPNVTSALAVWKRA